MNLKEIKTRCTDIVDRYRWDHAALWLRASLDWLALLEAKFGNPE